MRQRQPKHPVAKLTIVLPAVILCPCGVCRVLVQMLDDMLDVAQMETGNISLKPEPLKLAQFIQNLVHNFQTIQGETRRVLFKSDFAETVQTDARLIRQIAANLISNAKRNANTMKKATKPVLITLTLIRRWQRPFRRRAA